jgi:voltage-gated potassium channel
MERLRAARAGDGYARWERRTDTPLLWLALLFLAVLLVPLMIRLEPWQRGALTVISGLIWAVFTIDYAARLYLARERWGFVRSHPLDLLIILLPMLRPLRALRLLRLMRVTALLGLAHGHAHRSLHARVSAYVGATTVLVLVVSAVAMYDVERRAEDPNITSVGDALWWAATTVTTVGYGDRYPTTPAGRLIAVALMVVGIALLGVVTATVAAWFVGRLRDVQEAEERTEATLADVLAELREVKSRLDSLSGEGRSPTT